MRATLVILLPKELPVPSAQITMFFFIMPGRSNFGNQPGQGGSGVRANGRGGSDGRCSLAFALNREREDGVRYRRAERDRRELEFIIEHSGYPVVRGFDFGRGRIRPPRNRRRDVGYWAASRCRFCHAELRHFDTSIPCHRLTVGDASRGCASGGNSRHLHRYRVHAVAKFRATYSVPTVVKLFSCPGCTGNLSR